jgi:hypothetical protein
MGGFMFRQYREYPFESELKEVETRLIARGFNKAPNNHDRLKSKEYKIIYHFGAKGSSQEPLRYGIEWIEG